MFRLAGSCGFATLFAVLCLGGAPVHAQVSPLRYWIPGGPFALSGSAGQSSETYGNFPSFTADGRQNFQSGFFVGSERGNAGSNGISQGGASGNFSALSYESTQLGYNYKTAGGLPVTFFAGFDTLKYVNGIGSSLAPLTSGTSPGYGAFAGVEFKPTSNLSLSFGVGYTQQQSGRMDSDINSSMLPGESPVFGGLRR
ncbi:porin family protein [Bradyrhizobium sp. 186]|uniref:porin family protein n=1 Tax=Bradyrhizobium sp. 186 TaxID=2782654 RepID=UPI002000AF03|nr:porin family protein [Bradyrhizobium sp. 186]UPK33604.1 porin family protein [Bradyrhizobium sp. 186]